MGDQPHVITADRLTLVSHVGWFELEQPQFVGTGERYWVDFAESVLVVEDLEGRTRRYPRKPSGPDTIR